MFMYVGWLFDALDVVVSTVILPLCSVAPDVDPVADCAVLVHACLVRPGRFDELEAPEAVCRVEWGHDHGVCRVAFLRGGGELQSIAWAGEEGEVDFRGEAPWRARGGEGLAGGELEADQAAVG